MNKLINVLRGRSDGYWELMATAAGHDESMDRSMRGVSAKALEEGFNGPAVSPSFVQERVDAIAAFDARLLVDICAGWRAPDQVSLDLMNESADFWSAAWTAALRFLKKHGGAPLPGIAPVPRQIHLEQQILWPRSPVAVRSVQDLIAFGVDDAHGYHDYRRVDESVIEVEGALSEALLVQLLSGSAQPNDSQLERLRILVPRPHLIHEDAQARLRNLLSSRWLALREAPEFRGGLLVLLDLVMVLEREKELSVIEDHFIEVRAKSESPRSWAPFGYLLLRRGWHVP